MRAAAHFARGCVAVGAMLAAAACQDVDVSRSVGARCDISAECDDRCLAPSVEWPGGFCTLDCDSDSDCPADTACVLEANSGVCAYLCVTDPGCDFLGEGADGVGYGCKERDAHPDPTMKVMVCRG
jgi:hypothetical protein